MSESLREIAEDKDKVEEMGRSIGFNEDEEIETLEKALKLRGIDEEVLSDPINPENPPHEYSVIDHLRATLGIFTPNRVFPSHAEIVDIDYTEDSDELRLDMEAIGYNATITETYHYSSDPSEDLISIFSITDSNMNQPSTLVGSQVPIHYNNGGYESHLPPKEPGVFRHMMYKIVRNGRNRNMLRTRNGTHSFNSKGYLFAVISLLVLNIGMYAYFGVINLGLAVSGTINVLFVLMYLIRIASK